METYKMSEDLYTYVEEVDAQHQTLIDLANELASSLGKANRKDIKKKLDFLGDYTVEHFAFEERLQRESEYPGYGAHLKEHDSFLSDWVDMKLQFLEDGKSPKEMEQIISEKVVAWVVNHIYNSDKQFAQHYRSKTSGNVSEQK